MIVTGESRYTYNLKADGSIESFPLQMGNGWYTVCVLENSEGNEYRYLFIKTVNAAINNENDVYLNSIQNINWNYEMEAIKKASELFSGLDAQEQKIKAVYDFITEKIRYDYEKMRNVDTSYVPDIDNTLQAKEYATIMLHFCCHAKKRQCSCKAGEERIPGRFRYLPRMERSTGEQQEVDDYRYYYRCRLAIKPGRGMYKTVNSITRLMSISNLAKDYKYLLCNNIL